MASFFDGAQTNLASGADLEALQKSLTAMSAGYGTDSAAFTGGRALIPENCEPTVMNVLAENKWDCKVMNMVKKTPVKSSVHEVVQRINEGEYRFLTVQEGGEPANSQQDLRRKIFSMRYTTVERGITKQMEVATTFENAMASEKIAGVDTLIKALEHQCLQGNNAIVGTEFDSFETAIRNAPEAERNIISLRGKHLKDAGEQAFDDIAMMCRMKGGFIDRAIFPLPLAKDVKFVTWDKFRFAYHNPNEPLPSYATAAGVKIDFDGENAGGDRFYQVKGKVYEAGDPTMRPAAPASVKGTVVAPTDAEAAGSEFSADDKGGYYYTVHAINNCGISKGVAATATGTGDATAVAVDTRGGAQLVIKAGDGIKPSGYIICRSKKDAADETNCMEMVQIPAAKGDTTFIDLNHELPGTASMVFLPKQTEALPAYALAQFMPVSTIPLPIQRNLVLPFVMAFFGALEVRAPQHLGLITNIGYDGGLY